MKENTVLQWKHQAEKGNGKSSTYLVGPTHVEAVGNGALESSPARACKIGFADVKHATHVIIGLYARQHMT